MHYHSILNLLNLIMAMTISNIPVLTGEAAERFVRLAEQAEKERGIIDFSKEREVFKKMLKQNKNK